MGRKILHSTLGGWQYDFDCKQLAPGFGGHATAVFLHHAAGHFQLISMATAMVRLALRGVVTNDIDNAKALPFADQQVDHTVVGVPLLGGGIDGLIQQI